MLLRYNVMFLIRTMSRVFGVNLPHTFGKGSSSGRAITFVQNPPQIRVAESTIAPRSLRLVLLPNAQDHMFGVEAGYKKGDISDSNLTGS